MIGFAAADKTFSKNGGSSFNFYDLDDRPLVGVYGEAHFVAWC